MNRLREFFIGRNGVDALNVAILLLSGIINFVLSFFGNPYLKLISIIPVIFFVFRMFSKNIQKRQEENRIFLSWIQPLRNSFFKAYLKWQKKSEQKRDTTHKYYNCPKCKKTLRVPSNRGKIEITCPHCNTKFKKNTGKKI